MAASTRKRIATNIAVNQIGLFVNIAVAFFLMPFLIERLGETVYGLWVLIGVAVTYFNLLDPGISSSVGRFVAHYEARKDAHGLNVCINSALGMLCIVGGIVLLASLILMAVFTSVFEVPPELHTAVRVTVMLMGLNLALTFLSRVFDGILWGYQRFDLLNVVDIPITLLRFGGTLAWVIHGGGLIALSVVFLICNVLAGVAKAILSFRQEPRLALSPTLMTREASRELFGFGFWNFMRSINGMIMGQTDRIVIGWRMAVENVTPYQAPVQLMHYAGSLTAALTGVMTPEATRRNALDDDEGRRRLLIHGTRICTTLACFFAACFFFLGRSFLVRYLGKALGPDVGKHANLIYILGFGTALGITMSMNAPILVSMARHKYLAYTGFVSAIVNVILSILLVGPYGMVGVAIGTTVPRVIGALFVGPRLVCHFTRTKLRQFYIEGLMPVLWASIPVFLVGYALTWWRVDSWPVLFAKGGIIATGFTIVGWFVALTARDRKAILEKISETSRRLRQPRRKG